MISGMTPFAIERCHISYSNCNAVEDSAVLQHPAITHSCAIDEICIGWMYRSVHSASSAVLSVMRDITTQGTRSLKRSNAFPRICKGNSNNFRTKPSPLINPVSRNCTERSHQIGSLLFYGQQAQRSRLQPNYCHGVRPCPAS